MTAISLFMATNVELFAVLSTILSICFVLLRNRGRLGEEVDLPESSPVDRKQIPRKLGKKSTAKKKKNKIAALGVIHNLDQGKTMDCQTAGQTKDSVDENDRKRGRSKKGRNTSPKPQAEVAVIQQKVRKLYSPLPIYTRLQLEPIQLYQSLLPYTLNYNQLRAHGFPLDHPANPGKVVLYNLYKTSDKQRDPTERWCARCNAKFSVTKEGEYQADTVCRYHPGKRLSIGSIAGAGAYSCCPHDSMAEGCVTSKHHVTSQKDLRDAAFLKTRYKGLHPVSFSRIFALDCEMCYTVQGLEVARISVVGEDGLAIYDSHVLPEFPIIDYNTKYSGITQNDMRGVTTTLADVQAFLLKTLSTRTILVGHGLENDLKALRIIHENIVDTSIVFPHPYGMHYKMSLRSLAAKYLKRTIQDGESGHDSVEDARTCIELMLLKVESDKQMAQEFHPISIPTVQPWPLTARPVQMNPFITPCSVGYWVPPVGSCCELY